MAQNPKPFFQLWGWSAQGDCCGLTFYQNKNGNLVFFEQAPPDKPPSPLQTIMRNKFRNVASIWQSLPASIRKNWMDAAVKANLRIHGYDLYTYYQIKQDTQAIRTIERLTGLNLYV